MYVDNSIEETSLVRNYQDNDFNNHNLTNINSITLKKPAKNDNEIITKAYVDQFHQENEQSRRNLGTDFYDESSDLVNSNQDSDLNDNKLTNLDSITVNRNPTSDNELSTKKYFDDELDKNTVLNFIQKLENFLNVSVGNDTYNFTKYYKIQITNTTIIRFGGTGANFLQNWYIKCNDKNNNRNIHTFVGSTKTNSPNSHSGATSLPPIGDISCLLKQVLIIMVITFLSASNERISFQLVI